MKHPAPVLLIGASRNTPVDKSRTVGCMKRLHDKLVSLGIVVKFLAASEGSHPRAKVLKDWGDCIEEGIPGSVLRVSIRKESEKHAILWPRDLFQIFRTDVHTYDNDQYLAFIGLFAPALSRVAEELLDRFKITSRTKSRLSEGGLSITDGDLVVVSSKLGMYANDLGDFSRYSGYYCAILPSPDSAPNADLLGMSGGEKSKGKHIDLDFNMVSAQDGTRLILVDEVYYEVFKKEVDALVRILREVLGETTIMCVVPQEEQLLKPVNFIALPDSRVVMPSECKTTQEFLEEHLGKERVITVPVDEHFVYNNGGGFRCQSALIAFSEYPDRAPDPRITSLAIDGVTMFIPHPSLHSHPLLRVGAAGFASHHISNPQPSTQAP